MAPRSQPLSRNLYVVSAVSFFQDAASEMLYPVLPLFLTTVLGAAPAAVGLIEGLADGTASATRAIAGRLADLGPRRPIIATGYGVSSIGKILVAAATVAGGWPLVLVARVTDRFGKGLRGAPRDALIADETTSENRGRAFGFHRAADTAGAVVGPLLGLTVYELLGEGFRSVFLFAVLPAIVSTLLVFSIHERARPLSSPSAARTSDARIPLFSTDGMTPRYWRLLGFLGVFAAVNFPDALLLLRANDLGLGIIGVVLAYVLYNVTYAGFSYPAGLLSDRFRRRHVFALGLFVFAVTYLGFGLTPTSRAVWWLLPLYGCYSALTDGVSRAWVTDLVPAEHRGIALGLQGMVTGIGLLVAGVWSGLAWGGTGHGPFLVSGSAALVMAFVLAFRGRALDPVRHQGPRP